MRDRTKLNNEKKWRIMVVISFLVSFAFALFNGVLGVVNKSIWNGSICVYYLLLLAIKLFILIGETKSKNNKKVFIFSSVFLIFIDLAMFAPITIMVLNQKEVKLSLIASIAVAAYTTYKITMAIINYNKNKRNENLSFRQIRAINLIDAILSILTLQNTLIAVNGGVGDKSMFYLSIVTSFVGTALILFISIAVFVRGLKYYNK